MIFRLKVETSTAAVMSIGRIARMLLPMTLLAVVVVLAGLLVAQQLIHNRQTTQWMRAFSDKQGIPASILAGIEPGIVKAPLKGDTRKRVSVPVGGHFTPWKR
jgi:hypothetical protein